MTARMTINGRPVGGTRWTPVENPALGETFAQAPDCSPAELAMAVDAAAAAFPAWSAQSHRMRRDRLLACHTAVAAHADEISELLTREQGKPLRESTAEIALAVDWFRHTAELVLPPERAVDDEAAEIVVDRVPRGVVAAIAPSNFPIILAVAKVAPALLAGNTVVLKPSPQVPLSTLRLGEILAGVLPAGVLNVISGGTAAGAALIGHTQVRMISFTGSVEVGRRIAAAAAADFKHVVLELGGNDACILLPGIDVGEVAPRVFAHAMVNAGQFCAAVKRVYVSRGQLGEVTDALAGAARSLVVGNGLDPGTDLGPVLSGAQFARIGALVDDAGGRIVAEGHRHAGPGHFYPPTVVTDLPRGTALELTEQFGPVIPVIAYDDVAEAVARANSTEFGLGGSVWGEQDAAREVAAGLDCGTAWINTHGALRHNVPFGGVRSSGVGVEYGHWGLLEYTRPRVTHTATRPLRST